MDKYQTLRIERSNSVLADKVAVAESFLARAKGLLGRRELAVGEALLIRRCNSVHMFFMNFAIDVVFCDANGEVIKLRENLRPWTVSGICWKASYVIELPCSTIAAKDIRVGDRLRLGLV